MNGLNKSAYEYIISQVPANQVLLDEPMKNHTTFKVGGEAWALIKISDCNQLNKLIPFFNKVQIPYFVKGNGSNILVSDRGYSGVIIEIMDDFNDITVEEDRITAKSGALMSSIASVAFQHGLTGFEFASGIPGTIGGGVVMNAGAYGGELKEVVSRVSVMNNEGEILTLNNNSMEFGYRHSVIKNRPFIVMEVALDLIKGDRELIKNKMNELAVQRRTKQPLEYPSAGSTFKRPEGYYAGKLIMDAGLRGFTLGGASVSEKHCGFVINKHNASATDLYELIREVQFRVNKKFGVMLEPEILFLGDF